MNAEGISSGDPSAVPASGTGGACAFAGRLFVLLGGKALERLNKVNVGSPEIGTRGAQQLGAVR